MNTNETRNRLAAAMTLLEELAAIAWDRRESFNPRCCRACEKEARLIETLAAEASHAASGISNTLVELDKLATTDIEWESDHA